MRPEILFPLFADVSALPGVGPKTAAALEKLLGGRGVFHLLTHGPSSGIARIPAANVADAPDGAVVTLSVEVEEHFAPHNPRRPYRVRARAADAYLTLAWFHAKKDYLERLLPVGATRLVSGRIERFGAEIQMLHADHVVSPDKADEIPAFEPVYPLTAGVTNKTLRKAMAGALGTLPDLPEWHDAAVLAQQGWPDWMTAMAALHAPSAAEDLKADAPTRARLAYDEMLSDQLTLALVRARRKGLPGRALTGDNARVKRLLDAAPYAPTGAQKRAAREIYDDMAEPTRMGRLLQGDVGAGKTFVAALAIAKAAEAGVQTALMAPTEILARQHLESLRPLLEAAGIRAAALTGRDKGAGRRAILTDVAEGAIGCLVGTHALFQDDVTYQDLGLIIIDEQHRFGVSDRFKLTAKGRTPDLLAMTATPIPRTLTLAAYGDLDVSRLDEKPPGRSPIDTRVTSTEKLEALFEAVGRAIDKGDRVYWICPLVEESDVSDLAAAEDRWRQLATLYGEAQVGLLHGKLSPTEKDARAAAFKQGETKVLVATTVVEVGVDAPDATIIIIEHAERFGLAQLHQLRGRVGRGSKASSCVLLYKPPLGETARARLEIMRDTEDGFRIAEEDWRLRGPGDILGTRQSGELSYRLADLRSHGDLLDMAADDARAIIARDPQLESERGRALRLLLHLFERDRAVALLRGG